MLLDLKRDSVLPAAGVAPVVPEAKSSESSNDRTPSPRVIEQKELFRRKRGSIDVEIDSPVDRH